MSGPDVLLRIYLAKSGFYLASAAGVVESVKTALNENYRPSLRTLVTHNPR